MRNGAGRCFVGEVELLSDSIGSIGLIGDRGWSGLATELFDNVGTEPAMDVPPPTFWSCVERAARIGGEFKSGLLRSGLGEREARGRSMLITRERV